MIRTWVGRSVIVLVVWAGLWGYAVLDGRGPRPVLLAGAVLASLLVCWLAADIGKQTGPGSFIPSGQFEPFARGSDARLTRLAQAFSEPGAGDRLAAEVHSSLVTVTDDLLGSKYGISRVGDPETARAILGDQLWSYLIGPPRYSRSGYRKRLAGILDELEAL